MTPRPTLRLDDGDLHWTHDGVRTPERRPFTQDDAARLAGWNVRYRDGRRDPDVLADVGRELYDWLDGKERWLTRALVDARPIWLVEFAASVHPGEDEAVFLEAPWESTRGFNPGKRLLAGGLEASLRPAVGRSGP